MLKSGMALKPQCAFLLVTGTALALAACRTETSASVELDAIRAVVDRYVVSIDTADSALARQVWSDRGDISFLHPLGHEQGWEQIKSNFYQKTMADLFTARTLTIRKIAIKPNGDSAIAEFYWEFNATWRKDGTALKTLGRETQVLWKDNTGTWKLAHVHYSGMPTDITSRGL